MKGKAAILMVCLLGYLAGWTAVPRMMQVPVKPSTHCCAKMDKTSAHKCPKDTNGDKECANDCISCPLCYTTILPVISGEGKPSTIVSPAYGDLPVAYLYGYFADIWRPPNASSSQ